MTPDLPRNLEPMTNSNDLDFPSHPEGHVVASSPWFDFSQSLLSLIDCDVHGEDFSLPPSPYSSPLSRTHLDLLDGLSPLTTPDTTPPSSPQITPTISLPPGPINGSPTSQARKITSMRTSVNEKPSKKPPHRKKRIHASQAAWRKERRKQKRETSTNHYHGRENAYVKHVAPAQAVHSQWETSEAAVSGTAFVGLDNVPGLQKELRLEDLVGEKSKYGFKLVTWDGRTPTALVDASSRVVGILAGRPDDEDWSLLHDQAAEALENRRNLCEIPKKDRKHRRGKFPALRCGISYGGGQRAPAALTNSPANAKILEELNNLPFFKRVAGFASSVMATWAPSLHSYYSRTVDDLHSSDPSLNRIFSSSVFCAASYNLGPRTVCFRHKDFGNLPFGYCAVTSLGSFDPAVSGHLILWDLGLVVQFPSSSTILLPSAIVAHSNVTVKKEERRYSFAQYTAGGIFRWVENNCSTSKTYLSTLSPEQLLEDETRSAARWSFGLSLLPVYPTPLPKKNTAET